MAERPQLLAMATEIVSAHVSHNAVAVDRLPGLIQQVFNSLATAEQAATAPPKAEPAVAVKAFNLCRSCCLSGLRQKSHHAEAASDDGSQNDTGAVPAALEVTILISNGGTRLCEDRSALAKRFGLGRNGSAAPKKAGRKAARKAPRQR